MFYTWGGCTVQQTISSALAMKQVDSIPICFANFQFSLHFRLLVLGICQLKKILPSYFLCHKWDHLSENTNDTKVFGCTLRLPWALQKAFESITLSEYKYQCNGIICKLHAVRSHGPVCGWQVPEGNNLGNFTCYE